MLKKLIHILIFAGFWLCFTPWIVILLQQNYIIQPNGVADYFFQYTTLLFVLIVVYCIINRLFEHYYMKHEIQKRVRKITIKQQLERLEKGEINLSAAQRLSTFTKVHSPMPKRSTKGGVAVRKPNDVKKNMAVDGAGGTPKSVKKQIQITAESPAKKQFKEKLIKAEAPVVPENAELPDYEDAIKLLDENKK